MAKLFIATLLYLFTINALADVKNKEKAKFDLISTIETLINIDECRKGVESKETDSGLPRACNRLEYLSKYFFDKKKDRAAIEEYLNNEEERMSEKARGLISTYKFASLGKMILSPKCVQNRDPVDLDIYINKIKGTPLPTEEETAELVPMQLEPRNPAGKKAQVVRKPQSIFENEMSEE